MNFRTADGASYEGRDSSGHERFRVSIPFDEHGYFGRECPSCHQIFRVRGEDYDALPEDLVLTCPYCGHQDEHSEFITRQQRDRMMRVIQDAGTQMISDMLDKSFGSMARSTRSNHFVKVTYRSTPFYPQPLPGINEESLVRERQCASCGMRYAVFGEHRFCPLSGALGPAEVAADALAAERAKLTALRDIPEPQRAILREQGVFDRIAVDTLGRVVGVVETLASSAFRQQVPDAAAVLRGRGNVFQRLDDLAELFATHVRIDPRCVPEVDWPTLKRLWAARHSHIHADGIADERYLRSVPSSALRLGQRVIVTDGDALRAIELAGALCTALLPN